MKTCKPEGRELWTKNASEMAPVEFEEAIKKTMAKPGQKRSNETKSTFDDRDVAKPLQKPHNELYTLPGKELRRNQARRNPANLLL